jgi:hypothetical protein
VLEIWLQSGALFILVVLYILLGARVASLTHGLDQLAGLQGRVEYLERLVRRLEQTMPTSLAKGGWVDGKNPIKEDEWVPPVMKHTNIQQPRKVKDPDKR